MLIFWLRLAHQNPPSFTLQNEVACNYQLTEAGNYWNVETHLNDALPSVQSAHLAPSFWANLYELHYGMFTVNNNLKPKEDEVTSRPWEWPTNYKVRGSWAHSGSIYYFVYFVCTARW